jgi:methionyl-tRNA formyltransferase
LNYFLYRSFVQLLSLAVGTFGKKAVGSQISRYPISVLKLPNVNSSRSEISAFGPFDLGIALNFDQVIGEELLALCRYGILNTHASKLPNDKGISPAVWAFARGDNEIWTTIYKMDRGIDTGPVIHQFKISVLREDTVFSLYKRVCKEAGRELPNIVEKVVGNRAVFMDQEPKGAEAQLHWPNRHHSDMMRLNHRRYLKLTDLLDL